MGPARNKTSLGMSSGAYKNVKKVQVCNIKESAVCRYDSIVDFVSCPQVIHSLGDCAALTGAYFAWRSDEL